MFENTQHWTHMCSLNLGYMWNNQQNWEALLRGTHRRVRIPMVVNISDSLTLLEFEKSEPDSLY